MSEVEKIPLVEIDISENALEQLYPEAFKILLRDHTTRKNIFWATDNYAAMGEGYQYHDEILPEKITGVHGKVIMPRIKKDRELQTARVRDMAEVFTPSWVCNVQNNLVDSAWFGRENVFNTELGKTWKVNPEPIAFPQGRTWQDYVRSNRLEITCGEAPYITSRYDTTTGEYIPLERRIGILDRKLRIVSENVDKSGLWLKAAQEAYRSTYAYEWQGDNLLLAREAMLYTFIENYERKFDRKPIPRSISFIAYIISWNVWQMDGLKCVVPDSCHDEESPELFGSARSIPCPGCSGRKMHAHNGIYCLINDWSARKVIRFVDLLPKCKEKSNGYYSY